MSKFRRQLMMASMVEPVPPTPPLPYDAEVEFLQSSGTQYIDTGIYVNGATTEFRMKYNGFGGCYFACGCRTAYDSKAFVFSNGGSNTTTYNKYFLNYSDGYDANVTCPNDTNVHELIMNNSVSVDGTTIKTFASSNFTTDRTLWIFGSNNADAAKYGVMRIYSCQIYQNGTLVRDMIPVRVGTTGYMYDRVSGQLFGNGGSGSLIVGADKNTPLIYDAQVEYLESDGNAYIDTGVSVKSTVQFEAKIEKISSFTSNGAFFGGRVANNNNSLVVFGDVGANRITWRFGNRTINASTFPVGEFMLLNLQDNKTLSVNGTNYSSTAATFTTVYNFVLFAMNDAGVIGSSTIGLRIKYIKLYDGESLVRDYIPVRKNGVGYMYDKMSGQLYGNARNTGAFTYGNDITT